MCFIRSSALEKFQLEFLLYGISSLWKQNVRILLITLCVICAFLIHVLASSLVTISGNKRIRTLLSVFALNAKLDVWLSCFHHPRAVNAKANIKSGNPFEFANATNRRLFYYCVYAKFWTLQNELQWNFDHSLPLCHSLSLRLSIHRVLISNYSNHLSNQDK